MRNHYGITGTLATYLGSYGNKALSEDTTVGDLHRVCVQKKKAVQLYLFYPSAFSKIEFNNLLYSENPEEPEEAEKHNSENREPDPVEIVEMSPPDTPGRIICPVCSTSRLNYGDCLICEQNSHYERSLTRDRSPLRHLARDEDVEELRPTPAQLRALRVKKLRPLTSDRGTSSNFDDDDSNSSIADNDNINDSTNSDVVNPSNTQEVMSNSSAEVDNTNNRISSNNNNSIANNNNNNSSSSTNSSHVTSINTAINTYDNYVALAIDDEEEDMNKDDSDEESEGDAEENSQSNSSRVVSTDNWKESLGSFINAKCISETITIIVSRQSVYESAMRALKRKKFSWFLAVAVKFVGESIAVDPGGPKREFFTSR